MFIDVAKVKVKAGNGGNGVVSFRHEIYVDKGGPDGGDGGDGGNVVFVASRNNNTLANFRFQREISADPGKNGSKRNRHGRRGKDLEVSVPVGTSVVSESGEILADFVEDGQRAIIAKGGDGGYGNAHFTSSVRQTPRVAEKGEPGAELSVVLELKMIADVGLVGLPNAGKSTLLSVVSNARPEIDNYPFTTLTPNLGVVDFGKESMLFADIPGLIEGAAEGKGLGDDFLRHVERTSVLLHLIDVYNDDLIAVYNTIQSELASYKVDLSQKPQLVVLTKVEGIDDEMLEDRISEIGSVLPESTLVIAISSQSSKGLDDLKKRTYEMVQKYKKDISRLVDDKSSLPVLTISEDLAWNVQKVDDAWLVKGRKIEKFAARTDFESFHGIQRLRDIMRKMGIMHELERQGITPGEHISIAKINTVEY